MADTSQQTAQLRNWMRRLRGGDPAALNELLQHVSARLQALARRMLKGHPAVQRWVQTDDVLQGALVRLVRALQSVEPDSMRGFLALAAQQIRRELIDLARHYYGPEGLGAHHASRGGDESAELPAHTGSPPDQLAQWYEFHQKIDQLPDEEREVVGLLFYQGLTQPEAAELLQVTVRTVQRRWHRALLRLHDIFGDSGPDA